MPIDLSMTTEQQRRVRATPTTLSGLPASLDGGLAGEVLSGDATVVAGVDDLEVIVRSGSTAGPISVRFFADADLGEGVVVLEDTGTGNITGAMAANLGISASAPEVKS